MEEQLVTAVVILVLSAAFDIVDHDLLLEVLEKRFGITGSARLWYRNYLKPRKFKVEIGQKKSETTARLQCTAGKYTRRIPIHHLCLHHKRCSTPTHTKWICR